MASEIAVEYKNVTVSFPAPKSGGLIPVVMDVDLEIKRDGFVSVIGPSGCGKSTLLNIAAGLLFPSHGSVSFKGEKVRGVDTRIGYVTQDSNLLPWMTVLENVALPLKFAGIKNKAQREERSRFWLERVGLAKFADYYPRQLSGGMQRRCAIARSFTYGPEVLLMDEPFGALDALTRVVLQQELLNLWERERKTILFVTHDLAEAITLSDTIVVMSGSPGRIEAVIDVPLSRPRNVGELVDQAEYVAIHKKLWKMLEADLNLWPSQERLTSDDL